MKKQLQKWIEIGYISNETAEAILADRKELNSKLQGEIYCFILYLFAISPLLLFLDSNGTLPLIFGYGTICTIFSLIVAHKLLTHKKKFVLLGHTMLTFGYIVATVVLFGLTLNSIFYIIIFPIWTLFALYLAYLYKSILLNLFIPITTYIFLLNIFLNDFGIGSLGFILSVLLLILGHLPILIQKHKIFALSYKISGLLFLIWQIILWRLMLNQ